MSINNDYDKYRGMTHKQIHDIVFEGYESGKENRLKEIFDEDSEYNRRLEKEMDIFEHLTPNEKDELEKLGFYLYSCFESQGYIVNYYKDREGRTLEVTNGLGGYVSLEDKDLTLKHKSDIVGVNGRLILEKLESELEESNAELDRNWSINLRRTEEEFKKLDKTLNLIINFFNDMREYYVLPDLECIENLESEIDDLLLEREFIR